MTNKQIPVIVICGPTASGKSMLGLQLAQLLNGEIVSADSMQIYKHMDIGTAKPTLQERADVRHHLIDILQPDYESSVYMYVNLAKKALDDINSRKKIPLLVGGTGLYIKTLISGMVLTAENKDDEYRQELYKLATINGVNFVHKMLSEVDPQSAANIHPNNVKRVIRALEIYKQSGITKTQADINSKLALSNYAPIYVYMDMQRDLLYNSIEKRVDKMMDDGLLNECKNLNYSTMSVTAKAAIGYKELFEHINNNALLDLCVDNIKINSKKYAKRQITWFKTLSSTLYVNPLNYDINNIVYYINDFLRENV